MSSIGVLDGAIVVTSLIVVFSISIWVTFFRPRGCNDSASEFFLAGRNTPWMMIAASLVASNIGTEHFVGQAGAAAHSGVVLSLCEWLASALVLSLGWFFSPVYLRVKLNTVPQFLEERFNVYCRGLYVGMLLIFYVLSKIGTSIYAGVVLMDVILGWSMWQSVPLIVVSTALYTMGGGLKAVIYTDAMQFLIFLGGGIAGSVTAFNLVGGVSGLFEKLESVGLESNTHIFRSVYDRDFPGLAMVFSIPITGIAYWCIDQEMVQRVLAGKNLSEVRLGTSTAGLLKLVSPFITVFPGIVARALFEVCRQDSEYERFSEWCSADLDDAKNSDRAYPLLIVNSFPAGIKGLMIASFISAMMSSISSIFNSASTIFTYDIYQRMFGPPGGCSPDTLRWVGRAWVVVMTILTLMYLPVIAMLDRGLYVLGTSALSHMAPPLSALFVAGVFIKRSNGEGALTGLIAGSFLGLARFGLSIIFQKTCDKQCSGSEQILNWKNWFVCLNFNYFAIILFAFTMIVTLGMSMLYPPTDRTISNDYTFGLADLTMKEKKSQSCIVHEPLLIEEEREKGEPEEPQQSLAKYVAAIVVSLVALAAAFVCILYFK